MVLDKNLVRKLIWGILFLTLSTLSPSLHAQAPITGKRIGLTFIPSDKASFVMGTTAPDAECWIDLNNDGVCQPEERLPQGEKQSFTLPKELQKATIYGPISYLNLNKTALSELDLSHTDALRSLWCYNTLLTKIDVTGQPDLEELFCYFTAIQELDLSHNPKLAFLGVQNCLLTAIDLTTLPLLTEVYLDGNPLGSINIKKNPKLKKLACMKTGLSQLDLSACPQLTFVECSMNKLTSLDLSRQSELDTLKADVNELTDLDVTHCPKLKKLHLGGNKLTTLDLQKNPLLEDLNLNNNKMESLDFLKSVPKLKKLAIKRNAFKGAPDFSVVPKLEYINMARCRFGQLDLSHNPLIQRLYCEQNDLKKLDLKQIPLLYDLIAFENELSDLDFSSCTKLQYADISLNSLTNEHMQHVVETLPLFKVWVNDFPAAGRFLAIDLADEAEKNDITDVQAAIAKAKEWEVYDAHAGDPRPYDGRTAVKSVVNTDKTHIRYNPGNARLYFPNAETPDLRCVQIYSTNGEEVLREVLDADETSLYVGMLTDGTYVVTYGNRTDTFLK